MVKDWTRNSAEDGFQGTYPMVYGRYIHDHMDVV